MSIEIAAIIGLAAIGIVGLFRRFGGELGGILLLLAVPIIGVFALVHSFQAFSSTTRVATVQASPVANAQHEMAISLTTYNGAGDPTRYEYELAGDRWELNADVVAFPDWMNFLGISNGFQLSRITSQYDDTNAHSIQPVPLQHSQTFSIPFLEKSHYTGGVLEPADGVTYSVFVTLQGQMYAVHA